MSSRAFQWRLACLSVAMIWVTGAQAAQYSMTGNLRFQIGHWLPVPITLAWPPEGKVRATPGAVVTQLGGDPKAMIIHASQFTAMGTPNVLSSGWGSTPVMQVQTTIAVQFPTRAVTLGPAPDGRTGPANVTWCPGQPTPNMTYNPNCTTGEIGGFIFGQIIPGRLRYQKTANQFGGPARAAFQGPMRLALNLNSNPHPCHFITNPPCQAYFAIGSVPQLAIGAAFGSRTTGTWPAPIPGYFNIVADSASHIISITPIGLGPGLSEVVSSWGGAWTTGRVISSAITEEGSERWTRTGYDNREDGVGNIQLVAGAVSNRQTIGPTANRGWLNITTVPEPAAVVSAASALLLLAACHSLVRRWWR